MKITPRLKKYVYNQAQMCLHNFPEEIGKTFNKAFNNDYICMDYICMDVVIDTFNC